MNYIQKTLTALKAVGYVASEKLATQISLLLTSHSGMVKAMILDGPAGAGKTLLAKSVARILGVDYIYTQAHPGSSPEDFLYDANIVQILKGISGDKNAVKTSEDVIELGFLPRIFRASQNGLVVAFVDEIDKASPKTDSLFLTALQEGEIVIKGIGKIKANLSNLVLFFTKNNERQISEPLMRRCRREYLGFPTADLELAILTGKIKSDKHERQLEILQEPVQEIPTPIARVLIAFANQLREKQEDLIKPPATQELEMAGHDIVRLSRWGAMSQAGEITFNWLAGFQEDQEILKQITTKEKVRDLLVAAIKSQVSESAKNKISKTDESFFKFGT